MQYRVVITFPVHIGDAMFIANGIDENTEKP